MKNARRGGFTLIELLTVIAIIAILAAMIFVAGPRVIERARIASWLNNCNQIRTACVGYLTHNRDSYPPAYGYRKWKAPAGGTIQQRFHLEPYVAKINWFRNFDIYDRFAQDSHDTDRDNRLSLLEFSPWGHKIAPDTYEFLETDRYIDAVDPPDYAALSPDLQAEVDNQMEQQRPIVYIPINRKQFAKVALYYYKVAHVPGRELEGWYAECWRPDEVLDGGNPLAAREVTDASGRYVVPARYDDFVLISPGPAGSTSGLLTPPGTFLDDLASVPQDDWYNILALRTYFLATRDIDGPDMEGDGLLDFDFRNRTRKKQGDPNRYAFPDLQLNRLPDMTNMAGPLIYQPTQ